MRIQLFIILVALFFSCDKKNDSSEKNNLRKEKQLKIKFSDTISGIYKTDFDSISNCQIILKISQKKGNYYYNLETPKRNIEGKIYFINDSSYLVLEGIQWDEDEDENKKVKPKGIPFLIFKNKLKLQNTGNSENHYTIFGECKMEHIQLLKK